MSDEEKRIRQFDFIEQLERILTNVGSTEGSLALLWNTCKHMLKCEHLQLKNIK